MSASGAGTVSNPSFGSFLTGHYRSRSVSKRHDRITERPRIARKRRGKQTSETIGRRLLEIVVYGKLCPIGRTLTLDDLAETEIGDWKMPDFKAACSYAASQGWLIVGDDGLTLTVAGLGADRTNSEGVVHPFDRLAQLRRLFGRQERSVARPSTRR